MISVDDLKEQVNIDASDKTHDAELQAYVDALTPAIERHTGQVMELREVVEDRWLPHTSAVTLRSTPVAAVTSVAAVDGSVTWNVGDLDVDAEIGRVAVTGGPRLVGLVRFIYDAGYEEVPADFQLAARIIGQHLWETQRGTLGSPEFGAGPVLAGYAFPNRAKELLGGRAPMVG